MVMLLPIQLNYQPLLLLCYLMMKLPLILLMIWISFFLYQQVNYFQIDFVLEILANGLFLFDNIEECIEINNRLDQKNIHFHLLDASFLYFVPKTLFQAMYQDTLSMLT